jgi:hypothetical protein
MRRFLLLALITLVACGGDNLLDPVQTVDGTWSATENGYSLSLGMIQADTLVGGSVALASLSGTFTGTVSGTFKYPDLNVTLAFNGFESVVYTATMSQTEAKLFGHLNGSGINNIEVDLVKK